MTYWKHIAGVLILTLSNMVGQAQSDCTKTFNDCNEEFQMIGGVEQSGLSSLNQDTGGFLSVFTRAPVNDLNTRLWLRARILSSPRQSTDNVFSVFSDPTGQLQKIDFTKVGAAIDYVFGVDYQPPFLTTEDGRYSASFIASAGATTPFSSQDVVLRFSIPPGGTRDCSTFLSKYPQLTPGTGANCVAPPTQFIALSNQDRSNFLLKWGIGLRTVTRFCRTKKENSSDCADDDANERGIVDLTVGQDQAITGGIARHLVFKLDGVHPLPIGDAKILYLFGSVAMRFSHNVNQDPLILTPADASQAVVPSAATALLPLHQSDRDFYRIGVGLNLTYIFEKLKNK